MILVIGGSGSGKSAYAEQMAVKAAGKGSLYYVATMQVYDEEGKKKVRIHEIHMEEDAGKLVHDPWTCLLYTSDAADD